MPTKRCSCRNPLCPVTCTGDFLISGVKVDGTWFEDFTSDDSPTCPTDCIFPSTILFSPALSDDVLRGIATPPPFFNCERCGGVSTECLTNIADPYITYLTHRFIEKLSAQACVKFLGPVTIGGPNRIRVTVFQNWRVDWHIDSGTPFPGTAYMGFIAVTRQHIQDIDQDSSCSSFCTVNPGAFTTRRINNVENTANQWGAGWEKLANGSTPSGGDFRDMTGGAEDCVDIQQAVRFYNLGGGPFPVFSMPIATLREPCWPDEPTVQIVCGPVPNPEEEIP